MVISIKSNHENELGPHHQFIFHLNHDLTKILRATTSKYNFTSIANIQLDSSILQQRTEL